MPQTMAPPLLEDMSKTHKVSDVGPLHHTSAESGSQCKQNVHASATLTSHKTSNLFAQPVSVSSISPSVQDSCQRAASVSCVSSNSNQHQPPVRSTCGLPGQSCSSTATMRDSHQSAQSWPHCDPSFSAYFTNTKSSPRSRADDAQEVPMAKREPQGALVCQAAQGPGCLAHGSSKPVLSTAPAITSAFASTSLRLGRSKHNPHKQGKHATVADKSSPSAWAVLTAGMACSDSHVGMRRWGREVEEDTQVGVRRSSDTAGTAQLGMLAAAPCAHWQAQATQGMMVRGLLGTGKVLTPCPASKVMRPASAARRLSRSILPQCAVQSEAGMYKEHSTGEQQQAVASQQQGSDVMAGLGSTTSVSGAQACIGTKPAGHSTALLMSRPETASSYWSAYDLEEGTLKAGRRKTGQAATGKAEGRLVRSSSASSLGRSNRVSEHVVSGARSISACEASSSSAVMDPMNLRRLHPALTWDPAVLIPCNPPVTEIPMDEKGRPYPYVVPPCVCGALPTAAFIGAAAAQAVGLQPLLHGPRMLVRFAGIANSPVKMAFREAGWRSTKSQQRWNVCWGHIPTGAELAALTCFQRVSHFPGTWELGRKDYLYRNVAALKRSKGDALDFIPRFFVMPRDLEELRADIERRPGQIYIQKPANSSRGRGVRMVVDPIQLVNDEDARVKEMLVQHYIGNPYTIHGVKFDMRVYVLATCMDPLRLYVYTNGLARFAAQRYSKHHVDLSKRCVHLTNYSVNKGSGGRHVAADVSETSAVQQETTQHKWSFVALWQHLEQDRGPDAWQRVWSQVHDIIAGAVLAAEPRLSSEVRMRATHRSACFEIWGFDILLDDELRAWLMEVNTCPSLAADTPLDKRIKTNMVADAMHLLGPVPFDFDAYEAHQQANRQARLTGLPPTHPTTGSGSSTLAGTLASSRCCTPNAGTGQRSGSVGPEGAVPRGPPVARPGTSSTAISSAGARTDNAGSGAVAARLQPPRTVQEAYQMSFKGVPVQQLPDVVVEAEAETARQRSWERVFPCTQQPNRYLNLFDTPRALSICLCKYYAHKLGKELQQPQSGAGKRPSSTPAGQGSQRAGASRLVAGVSAGTSQWRPGG